MQWFQYHQANSTLSSVAHDLNHSLRYCLLVWKSLDWICKNLCQVRYLIFTIFMVHSRSKNLLQWMLTREKTRKSEQEEIKCVDREKSYIHFYTEANSHFFNPFTSKILLVILLAVCYTVVMMKVWRIWH